MARATSRAMVSAKHHQAVVDELRDLKGHVQSLLQTAKGFYFYRLALEPGIPAKVRVVMVSPSIIEVKGIAVRDMDKIEAWFEHIHPEDKPRILETNQHSLETGALFDQVARWYHPVRREWVWLRAMSQPLFNAEGTITHFNGVCIDITHQRQSEEALKQSVAMLRNLALELTQAEDRERKRLAVKLHDDIQQCLVAATLKISLIDRKASAREHGRTVRKALELVGEAIASSRSLATDLYPPVMMGALTVKVSGEEIDEISEALSTLLFQGVRESLFNVVKHAGVKQASVAVSQPDTQTIQVVISDRGMGLSERMKADPATGWGLGHAHLRERLACIGGALDVASVSGKGVKVTIQCPYALPDGN